MAAKMGRDVTIGILTDTSAFDVEKPARELDDLGKSATSTAGDIKKTEAELGSLGRSATSTAGDVKKTASGLDALDKSATSAASDVKKTEAEIKRLEQVSKDAARDADRLNKELKDNKFDAYGKDAKTTATKVGAAFDSMAKAAKSDMAKVDHEAEHGMHEAGHSTAEFKDEAKQNLSEVSSSFQGSFQSVGDLIQGTLGGLVSSLGPLGAAAGAAGAIGIGLITKAFGDSQEAAAKAKAEIAGWTSAIIDAQGQITNDVVQTKLKDLFSSEDNTDKLRDLRTEAQRAGVDFITYAQAVSGSADAQEKLKQQWITANTTLNSNTDITGQNNAALAEQRKGLEEVANRTGINNDEMATATSNASDYAKATSGLNDAVSQTTTSFEGATTAVDDHTTALADNNHELAGFTDPAQTFITLLDDQKSAAEKAGTQFKITAKDVKSFIKDLGEQVLAQENFTKNLRTLAKKGITAGFIDELEAQGPAAASAVKALTTATPAQVKAINALYARQGHDAGGSWKDGLESQKGAAAAAAKKVHDAASAELAKKTKPVPTTVQDTTNAARTAHNHAEEQLRVPITIPTHVSPPPPSGPNSSANAAENALLQAQAYLNAHPLTFRVNTPHPPPQPGQGAGYGVVYP